MPIHKRRLLPLFFDVADKPCLVVGGGSVAARKIGQLREAGAEITVIAPEACDEIRNSSENGEVLWHKRRYISPESGDYSLVIATTDDSKLNRIIYKDCVKRSIPVNVVDQPDLCTVIFPSIVKRSFITLAISSGGSAPYFTQALREKLEGYIDHIFQLEKPELLIEFRNFVRAKTDDWEVKRKLYRRLLDCDKKQWEKWSETKPPYDLWKQWLEDELQ